MALVSLKEFSEKTGRPWSTVYDRIGIFKIKPIERRTAHSPSLYDEDELKKLGIGSLKPAHFPKPIKRSHHKGPVTRKNEIKDETPIGVIAALRNHNCPEYSACLDEAAFKNIGLKCSGCVNEKASINAMNIDFTETTREMSGSTVYRVPFK